MSTTNTNQTKWISPADYDFTPLDDLTPETRVIVRLLNLRYVKPAGTASHWHEFEVGEDEYEVRSFFPENASWLAHEVTLISGDDPGPVAVFKNMLDVLRYWAGLLVEAEADR
jgi:hypothetical protein